MNGLNFDAGSFRTQYDLSQGQLIWEFLQRQECVDEMMVMSSNEGPKKAAVEGVEQLLLRQFGNSVAANRTKQMIGRMVRQILENNGFRWVSGGTKCTGRRIFSSGAYYEEME